ncbi:MAG: hypothetical protein ICV64_09390 [Thermoleophilia bacterium]|nr:hypothetical protein [Thermoleophilia bacterium]
MSLDVGSSLNLALGLLQLALAAVVLRNLGRFGRAFPWLAALMAFFALRGVDRLYVALADEEPVVFSAVLDGMLLVVLVLLLVGLERTVRGLRVAIEDADLRTVEYERALQDYRALARHRLANPLAAIRGGITTLRETPLDEATREQLLAMIESETRRLEQITLDPEPIAPEERSLRPRPETPRAD